MISSMHNGNDSGGWGSNYGGDIVDCGNSVGICQDDIGRRVQIGGEKCGTLRYIGQIDGRPGIYCGIELDEPFGKNDGSINGKLKYLSYVYRKYLIRKPGFSNISNPFLGGSSI